MRSSASVLKQSAGVRRATTIEDIRARFLVGSKVCRVSNRGGVRAVSDSADPAALRDLCAHAYLLGINAQLGIAG